MFRSLETLSAAVVKYWTILLTFLCRLSCIHSFGRMSFITKHQTRNIQINNNKSVIIIFFSFIHPPFFVECQFAVAKIYFRNLCEWMRDVIKSVCVFCFIVRSIRCNQESIRQSWTLQLIDYAIRMWFNGSIRILASFFIRTVFNFIFGDENNCNIVFALMNILIFWLGARLPTRKYGK